MKYISIFILCAIHTLAHSQKQITEGTITYNIVTTSTDNNADYFKNATLTIYLKGSLALQELKTPLFVQSILFDSKSDKATIIKESGDQKYIIHLSAEDWKDYNKRYENIEYLNTDEFKNILGNNCKKTVGHLKDKSELTAFYTTDLSSLAKGYEYQFKNLPGIVLEYEISNNNTKVKYTASKISFSPVPAIKFEIPKSGYRILDYKSN